MNKYRESCYYDDPSEAYEVGKNWCVSIPYHELDLIEDVKELAKATNCKSTAQFVRNTLKREIRNYRRELQAV